MSDGVDQIELRWSTPEGRLNAHSFRDAVGFALGASARDRDWGWLFNDVASQPGPGAVATSRFFTGGNTGGTFAGLTVVGQDACQRLSEAMLAILPAVRAVQGVAGHPAVRHGRVWWKATEHPNAFRVTTLVLNRIKGDQARYDALRADCSPLIPVVAEAIASGLDRMALRVGLPAPGLTPADVEVVSMGPLSGVPVGPSGRGMRSRLTHAIVRMPLRLQGDWRVGGLVGYGNGGIAEQAKERHWRPEDAPAVPHPRFPRKAA